MMLVIVGGHVVFVVDGVGDGGWSCGVCGSWCWCGVGDCACGVCGVCWQ